MLDEPQPDRLCDVLCFGHGQPALSQDSYEQRAVPGDDLVPRGLITLGSRGHNRRDGKLVVVSHTGPSLQHLADIGDVRISVPRKTECAPVSLIQLFRIFSAVPTSSS